MQKSKLKLLLTEEMRKKNELYRAFFIGVMKLVVITLAIAIFWAVLDKYFSIQRDPSYSYVVIMVSAIYLLWRNIMRKKGRLSCIQFKIQCNIHDIEIENEEN